MGACGSSSARGSEPVLRRTPSQLNEGFIADRAAVERISQLVLSIMSEAYGIGDPRTAALSAVEQSAPHMRQSREKLLATEGEDEDFALAVAHAFLDLDFGAKPTDVPDVLKVKDGGKQGTLVVHPRPSLDEVHYVRRQNRLIPPFPEGFDMCVFAAGCFWGTEKGFWRLPGVYSTAVGYIDGKVRQPTYKDVCTGRTGHTEGTLVVWDPSVISFCDLCRRFFDCHDPTQGNGQGNDRGTQYRSGIYCANDEQKQVASACLSAFEKALKRSGFRKITTEVKVGSEFWYAEAYHQQYLAKPNARQYCSAEPTGVAVPPPSEWAAAPATLIEKYAPKLPAAFWASYDGSIRTPNTPAVLDDASIEAAAEARRQELEEHGRAEAAFRSSHKALLRFCGGCGFKPKAEELAAHLQSVCGLEVALLRDVGTTGNFELELRPPASDAEGGGAAAAGWALVHSKKGGDGFVDSEEKMLHILKAWSAHEADPAAWVESRREKALDFGPIEVALAEAEAKADAVRNEAAEKRLREEVDFYISMAPALIFSKSYCPFCKKAKALFNEKGVFPVVFELDQRLNGPSVQAYLLELTGQKTVPSIWLDGGFIGGFTDFEKHVAAKGLKAVGQKQSKTHEIVKSKGLTQCGAADGVPCVCGISTTGLEAKIRADARHTSKRAEPRVRPEEKAAIAAAQKKYPGCVIAGEAVMKKKAHGTSAVPVQQGLRWDVDRDEADRICNFNRHFAEHAGYFAETAFAAEAKGLVESGGMTFYDSNTGKPLFSLGGSPTSRPMKAFLKESRAHGWPSFRTTEVNWDHVRVLPNGEVVSLDGTHLGHNLPDKSGNRFCINLVSIAGRPA